MKSRLFITIVLILLISGCVNLPFKRPEKITLGKGIIPEIIDIPQEIIAGESFSINLGLINYLDESISGEIRIIDDYYIIDKTESFNIEAALLDKRIRPAKIPEEGNTGIEITSLLYDKETLYNKGIRNKEKIFLSIVLNYETTTDIETSIDTKSKGYTLSGSSLGVVASTAPVGIERINYNKEGNTVKLRIYFRNFGGGRIPNNEIKNIMVSSEGKKYSCDKTNLKINEKEDSIITCKSYLEEGKHTLRISYSYPYEATISKEIPVIIEE